MNAALVPYAIPVECAPELSGFNGGCYPQRKSVAMGMVERISEPLNMNEGEDFLAILRDALYPRAEWRNGETN